MSNWVKLDLEQPVHEHVLAQSEGATIEIAVSPYTIPDAVRGFYDRELERFVIQFRYLDDEPYDTQEIAESVWVRVGKYTERLHGIEIDVDSLTISGVRLNVKAPTLVDTAVDTLARQHPISQVNYDLTRGAIREHSAELFALMPTPGPFTEATC